jgi:phosphoribosylamine--glycine ligase/phosphoribosylformylglycinamidine cyclo-ligase
MKKHRIPTAEYKVFTEFELAKAYIEGLPYKYVIKASGLAAGKGVILPESLQEGVEGLRSIMLDATFGTAGQEVVIEERLEGQEVSCLAFSDGYTVVAMPGAQDHKRVFNGDKGLNTGKHLNDSSFTGGMGCYAPAPIYTNDLQQLVKRTVLQATVDAMRRDGTIHYFITRYSICWRPLCWYYVDRFWSKSFGIQLSFW